MRNTAAGVSALVVGGDEEEEGTEDTDLAAFGGLDPSVQRPGVLVKSARGMEGVLLKCSSGRLLSAPKRWKSRYFVIAGEYLLYYASRVESRGDAVARGAFDLHGVAIDALTGRPSITLASAEAGGALCVVSIALNAHTAENPARAHPTDGSGAGQGDDVLLLKALSESEAARWHGAFVAVVMSLGDSRGPPAVTRAKRGNVANVTMRVKKAAKSLRSGKFPGAADELFSATATRVRTTVVGGHKVPLAGSATFGEFIMYRYILYESC